MKAQGKLSRIFASFRFRILFTVILSIIILSFTSFFIFNHFLTKRIYKQSEDNLTTVLYFLRSQIIAVRDGRFIRPYLKGLENDGTILNSHLIDGEGKIVSSSGNVRIRLETLNFNQFKSFDKEITLQDRKENGREFTRAIIRFENMPACHSCHDPARKIIGYVLLDFSGPDSDDTVVFTRNFSAVYTIILIILLLTFVLVMHYKVVRTSLIRFQHTINGINKGDLSQRVMIPRTTELGVLGKSFNEMLANFQTTQAELQKYHKKEIHESQRLATIGEMSARLAHEIRNPITGISNAIEIIIEETGNPEHRNVLEEVKRQAYRVNKAVSNMLNYARSRELNKQPADLNEIIRSVVFFLQNQTSRGGISISTDLSPEIPLFDLDTEQIENALMNLGINAIQSCNPEGSVLFCSSFDQATGLVTVSVRDSGSGIDPEKIRDIFTPFYTTRTKGTGLGLAIVKEVTEMHGGFVQVENNPDDGCIFFLRLPVPWSDRSEKNGSQRKSTL